MSNTIGLIAGIALLSFPQISSIPATISPGSASLSTRFQEKSAEPSPQNRAAFNDEKAHQDSRKEVRAGRIENDADTLGENHLGRLGNHESQRTRTSNLKSSQIYERTLPAPTALFS